MEVYYVLNQSSEILFLDEFENLPIKKHNQPFSAKIFYISPLASVN